MKFKRNLKGRIEIFWDEVFIVRNTVKTGQSWRSAVICRKRSAFEMQFNLVVAPIFLKTYVQDHGESSSRLLEKKDLIIVHGGDLVSGFVNRGFVSKFHIFVDSNSYHYCIF